MTHKKKLDQSSTKPPITPENAQLAIQTPVNPATPPLSNEANKLSPQDLKIINDVKTTGEHQIPRINNNDIQQINDMGVHQVKDNSPIVYDKGSLTHFAETVGSPEKSVHLSPAETELVVSNPDDVLPNFFKGGSNSYLYVKKTPQNTLSIVEVLDDGSKLRVSHGGFKTTENYLKPMEELKKSILEDGGSLIGQPGQSPVINPQKGTAVVSLATSQDRLSNPSIPQKEGLVNPPPLSNEAGGIRPGEVGGVKK